jgi:hypothetical protein
MFYRSYSSFLIRKIRVRKKTEEEILRKKN